MNYGTRLKRQMSHWVPKRILQYDLKGNLIKEWASSSECKKSGFNISHICDCCNEKRGCHTVKGYIWKYKEE